MLVLLVALVAVDGPVEGHSWQHGVAIGVFDKSSLQCDARQCKAVVKVERVGLYRTGYIEAPATIDVDVSSAGSAIDHKGGEHWASAREAFALMADKDRVWLHGGVDCGATCSSLTMHGWLVVRLAPLPPTRTAPPGGPVFAACGSPPWSRATLARCADPGGRDRRVTVTATLTTKPFTELADLRAALSLRVTRAEASGVEVLAPMVDDFAVVENRAKVLGATPSHPRVAALEPGDAVVLEGYYQGYESPSGPCDQCQGAYFPRLVVDRAITFQKPAASP
jgi:hypothetical protein